MAFELTRDPKRISEIEQKKQKDKNNQIVCLYYEILEEFLLNEENKMKNPNFFEILQNEVFHKALICCCIEVVQFLNKGGESSNTIYTFPRLLDQCEITAFQFWKIIRTFLLFDKTMPTSIKKHIQHIEFKILQSLAWKKGSDISELVTNLNMTKEPSRDSQSQPNVELTWNQEVKSIF